MAVRHPRRSKAQVITALRALARRGFVRKADVVAAAPDIAAAAVRAWGTFAQARRAAGIGAPPRPRQWSRVRVLAEIRTLAQRGQRMTVEALRQARRHDLVSAAVCYVGRWARARELAGVRAPCRLPAHRDAWTARAVVAEIRARRRAGLPLAASRVPADLRRAGMSRFGNWGAAIERAGLRYADVRLRPTYTDDELRAEVRRLAQRAPRLTAEAFRRSKLGNVAIRRWGSVAAAVAAAGLAGWPAVARYPLPTRAEVLAALRARARTATVLVGDRRLAKAARRHFGTWHAALVAAGVSHLQAQQRWTAAKVVAALRRRQRTGASLSSQAIATSDVPLARAARRYFGTMVKAREAAGIHLVLRRRWTREAVLTELRRHAGRRTALRQLDVPARLVFAAAAQFGSWRAACAAAGLVPNRSGAAAPRRR